MPTPALSSTEHPFAQYVRILGKGKTGSRSLSFEEAQTAFGMILSGEALDVQIGAFLMLLRVKEESSDEIAGFVAASRQAIHVFSGHLPIQVDIDWSSYAGKRKHYPWFILAALTLARHGLRIFMHGTAGHTPNRLYTENVLPVLGLPICQSAQAVQASLAQHHFAYMPLSVLAPKLAELIELRAILGVRSPVHSLVRLLNPLDATLTLQAIFHPAYRATHQAAASRLGYLNSAVIKGEGGEFERNPDARTLVLGIQAGNGYTEEWDMLHDVRSPAESTLPLEHFLAVWQGHSSHDYGETAIIGTLALVLKALNHAQSNQQAFELAQQLWQTRHQPTAYFKTT